MNESRNNYAEWRKLGEKKHIRSVCFHWWKILENTNSRGVTHGWLPGLGWWDWLQDGIRKFGMRKVNDNNLYLDGANDCTATMDSSKWTYCALKTGTVRCRELTLQRSRLKVFKCSELGVHRTDCDEWNLFWQKLWLRVQLGVALQVGFPWHWCTIFLTVQPQYIVLHRLSPKRAKPARPAAPGDPLRIDS